MIIGISGKARSGKDTFAEMLATELNGVSYPPYVMMAFANELKLRCQAAFDLTWEQLWGEDKELADKRYRKPMQYHGGVRSDRDELPSPYWTAREIMQNYGAFYRTIDSQFWIKNLFKVAEEKEYTNVIVTDVRYTNEANYIIDHDGYVIRVDRETKDSVHNEEHPSEVELDDYKRFDFSVMNNWTLDYLKETATTCTRFLKDSEKDLKKIKEIKING